MCKKCVRPSILLGGLALFLNVLCISALFSTTLYAADAEDAEGEIVPADPLSSGPAIIIDRAGEDPVKEFRINGQLYMVKVTPRKGPPYYLVDSDGDGNLETRWNDLAPNLLIPAWVLKKW